MTTWQENTDNFVNRRAEGGFLTRHYELIWRRDQCEVVLHAYISVRVLNSAAPAEASRRRQLSTGTGPLGELRRQESARRIEERRYRFTLILAVAPVSAAMALAALYITVPAAFAERHVYSEIARPPLWEFMRAAAVVPIAGALLGSLLAFIATDLLGVPRSPARLLITLLAVGVIFGLFVPLATALVLPINLLWSMWRRTSVTERSW